MLKKYVFLTATLGFALLAAGSTLATRLQLIEHKELTATHVEEDDTLLTKDENPTKYAVVKNHFSTLL